MTKVYEKKLFLTALTSKFVYRKDKWIDSWRVLNLDDAYLDTESQVLGDCDDFAVTLAYYLSGGFFNMVWKVLKREVNFWYCKTESGEDHVVLEYEGEFVDNVYPTWTTQFRYTDKSRVWLPTMLVKMAIGLVVNEYKGIE